MIWIFYWIRSDQLWMSQNEILVKQAEDLTPKPVAISLQNRFYLSCKIYCEFICLCRNASVKRFYAALSLRIFPVYRLAQLVGDEENCNCTGTAAFTVFPLFFPTHFSVCGLFSSRDSFVMRQRHTDDSSKSDMLIQWFYCIIICKKLIILDFSYIKS